MGGGDDRTFVRRIEKVEDEIVKIKELQIRLIHQLGAVATQHNEIKTAVKQLITTSPAGHLQTKVQKNPSSCGNPGAYLRLY